MNPYEQWLGISSSGQPNHFELLGISEDENNLETISNSARSQLLRLNKHKSGDQAGLCEEIATQIKQAYRELESPEQRIRYKQSLHQQTRAVRTPAERVVYIDDEFAQPFVTWQVAFGALTTIFLLLAVLFWLIYRPF